MGTQFLADTNVLIDLLLGRLPVACAAWLERRIEAQRVHLSVINRIELLTKTEPPEEYALMQQLTQSMEVLPFDEPIIWETISLRQQRKVRKLPDAIIAATAIVHNFILITRNTGDFKNLPELTTLNLHNEQELMVLDVTEPEDM